MRTLGRCAQSSQIVLAVVLSAHAVRVPFRHLRAPSRPAHTRVVNMLMERLYGGPFGEASSLLLFTGKNASIGALRSCARFWEGRSLRAKRKSPARDCILEGVHTAGLCAA